MIDDRQSQAHGIDAGEVLAAFSASANACIALQPRIHCSCIGPMSRASMLLTADQKVAQAISGPKGTSNIHLLHISSRQLWHNDVFVCVLTGAGCSPVTWSSPRADLPGSERKSSD